MNFRRNKVEPTDIKKIMPLGSEYLEELQSLAEKCRFSFDRFVEENEWWLRRNGDYLLEVLLYCHERLLELKEHDDIRQHLLTVTMMRLKMTVVRRTLTNNPVHLCQCHDKCPYPKPVIAFSQAVGSIANVIAAIRELFCTIGRIVIASESLRDVVFPILQLLCNIFCSIKTYLLTLMMEHAHILREEDVQDLQINVFFLVYNCIESLEQEFELFFPIVQYKVCQLSLLGR